MINYDSRMQYWTDMHYNDFEKNNGCFENKHNLFWIQFRIKLVVCVLSAVNWIKRLIETVYIYHQILIPWYMQWTEETKMSRLHRSRYRWKSYRYMYGRIGSSVDPEDSLRCYILGGKWWHECKIIIIIIIITIISGEKYDKFNFWNFAFE